MIMTIRAITSAATTPAMIATLPPDGNVGSDCTSVGDGVGSCVVDGGVVGFGCMRVVNEDGGSVGFGCMRVVDEGGGVGSDCMCVLDGVTSCCVCVASGIGSVSWRDANESVDVGSGSM